MTEDRTEDPGVLEIGTFDIQPGSEDGFVDAFRGVREVLATTPGLRSMRMTRGIETPTRFVVLVEWDSVAAHLENFRATDRFVTWRAALSPHFRELPQVEHLVDIEAM